MFGEREDSGAAGGRDREGLATGMSSPAFSFLIRGRAELQNMSRE